MKNTLENKAKFFAQYWGQKVMRTITNNKTTGQGVSELMLCDPIASKIDSYFLELKPLSSISDEDLKHLGYSRNQWNKFLKYSIGFSSKEADYLRSKGYALDWNGITVEEMIEFGWIKLK